MTATVRTTAATGVQVTSPRTIARVTGWLFLITFIASIPAAFVLYPPVLNDPNYIISAGADMGVKLGALLEVILVVANIGTAVVLYPLVKRQNHIVALGYVTARVMEGAMIAVGILSLLSVVTLRQDVSAGTRLPCPPRQWDLARLLDVSLPSRASGDGHVGAHRRAAAHRGVCGCAVRGLRTSLPAGSHCHDPGVLVGAVA